MVGHKVEMLRLTLEDVRASGSTFHGSRVHPRKWDTVVSAGERRPFSTLYLSKEILESARKEFGAGARWKELPRKWDRKKRRWKYRYRHRVRRTDTGERRLWSWYTPEQWERLRKKRLAKDKHELEKHGKPHGVAYNIRREAWRVLNHAGVVPRALEWGLREGHERGKLVRVTVSLPDLSFAVSDLFLHELLPKIRAGVLDPEVVFLVLPTRGPGSGEVRSLFEKAVRGDVDERGLRKVISKSWRSIITKLVELHYLLRWEMKAKAKAKKEERKEVEEAKQAVFQREIASRFTEQWSSSWVCEECGLPEVVEDEIRGEKWCLNCGLVNEKNLPGPKLRCGKCGQFGHTIVKCPTGK